MLRKYPLLTFCELTPLGLEARPGPPLGPSELSAPRGLCSRVGADSHDLGVVRFRGCRSVLCVHACSLVSVSVSQEAGT